MFGVQFYPTPDNLVKKMLSKVCWDNVKRALEPSAGKGDIADRVKQHVPVDCIEIDNNLSAILKEKGYFLVGNDFLSYDDYTRYDLIVMNPPFLDGDKHLMKALSILKNGGQIVCLLNANTVKLPTTFNEKELCKILLQYQAEIEYIENAFSDAERKTDVEIAMVYVNIPYKTYDYDYFIGLAKAKEHQSVQAENQQAELALNDYDKNMVDNYNADCELGIRLLDTYTAMEKIIPVSGRYGAEKLIKIEVPMPEDGNNRSKWNQPNAEKIGLVNGYLSELRYAYWSKLFASKAMEELLTEETRTQFRSQIEDLKNYEFNISNIKAIKLSLSKNFISNIQTAIVKQFKDLSYTHSMDNAGNVHYYNGWKTNKAYKINQKVIVPCYGLYDNRWGGSWSVYRARDTLCELEKIFTYLDGGRKDGDSLTYNWIECGTDGRVSAKYFDFQLFKKGTIHVWFTDKELLKKFNIIGGKGLNFLPNWYGTKSYESMTKSEQSIVDEFEGKNSYTVTMSNPIYYSLQTSNLLALGVSAQA